MRLSLYFLVTFIFFAPIFYATPLLGQQLPTGPQVSSFFSDLDDSEQPYGLYLPPKYNPKKRYPLVVMLHGAGSNHRLALRRVFGKSNQNGETDVEATRYFPAWPDVEYVVAAPFARGTAGYQGFREKDVLDMLADVRQRFSIDENRIYLTGLSMGGGGTLWIGLSRADIWAAIAPVCPAPPAGTDILAPNAVNLPVHFFHGDKDPVVPVAISRDWTKNLRDLGTPAVEYKEFPGVSHDSWVGAYADGFVFKWFDQFRRNPHPDRVRLVSADYEHAKSFWIAFTAMTQGQPASIDAVMKGKNKLEATTKNLDGFRLNLANHPKFDPSKPIDLTIDGQTILAKVSAGPVLLCKVAGLWRAAECPVDLKAKQKGAEGPIAAAFATRHIYVYGTADSPTPEVLKARRDTATKAADWAMDRGWFLGRVRFFPRVISDKELRPSDFEQSNLILFGTKSTNTVIAQYADQLPMHLPDEAAKDHGLFYVFPVLSPSKNAMRYMAVNSGIPWWSGADIKGWRFMPPAQHLLTSFPDFLLYKNNSNNVISSGYFDAGWQLPEAAKQAVKGL